MLKNENIICISSIDWDFIWQGHQEIMSNFAQNGNRVLFIENTGVRSLRLGDFSRVRDRITNWFRGTKGVRKICTNLFVYAPIVLPFPYLKIAMWINRHLVMSVLEKWCRLMRFHNPVIWVFLPTPLSIDIINNLGGKIVIYYCIDNFRVSSTAAKKIRDSEIELLKRADEVFVTSKELYQYCTQFNSKVSIFPFAVNFSEFEKIRLQEQSLPNELRNIAKPIIGYIGGIHKWVDLELVHKAASQFPEYSFVFVGPLQSQVFALSGLKNVYFLGKKDHQEIPYYVKAFDACIIPYLITDYTRNVYPTKLNEYLAMGKPVISTNLPEVNDYNGKNLNVVYVGKDYAEFCLKLKEALVSNSDERRNNCIAAAKNNSWFIRIEEMSRIIENSLKNKDQLPFDWQSVFTKFYKSTKRYLMKFFVIFAVVLGIVFYTPIVWIVAEPLKISQKPRQVDCIVVFGGGVGETGMGGVGYEERVEYAIELYRKGFANTIIFSSGYTYVFKEPSVMKSIAVSQGVPDTAVYLEDKAKSTYENIVNTRQILVEKKLKSILLISSPYHMLRSALVMKKSAPDIEVTYSPIPNSSFYFHKFKDQTGKIVWRRLNLQQLRAILHEYLSIIYYWLKGYI